MAVAKTMNGARAQFAINGIIIGIINNVNYNIGYDVLPVYILGRFNPNELVLAGMEPVSVTATGFRVVDNGPYATMSVPQLQNLLSVSDVTLSIFDRQTNKQILIVTGCLSSGYSSGVAARSLQEMTCNFLGLTASDEAGTQDADSTASSF